MTAFRISPLLSGANTRFWSLSAIIAAAATVLSAIILPATLKDFFTGPEGVRWVAPLAVWLGTAASVLVFLIPHLRRKLSSVEATVAMGTAIIRLTF
jgi:hypothetical protein